jgi:predicted nucleic acid-binding protein
MPAFKHWETEMHEAGVAALLSVQRRHLSLVDCVSFDVIHRHGLSRAFAFDPHFAEQGFDCVPSIGKELVA